MNVRDLILKAMETATPDELAQLAHELLDLSAQATLRSYDPPKAPAAPTGQATSGDVFPRDAWAVIQRAGRYRVLLGYTLWLALGSPNWIGVRRHNGQLMAYQDVHGAQVRGADTQARWFSVDNPLIYTSIPMHTPLRGELAIHIGSGPVLLLSPELHATAQ